MRADPVREDLRLHLVSTEQGYLALVASPGGAVQRLMLPMRHRAQLLELLVAEGFSLRPTPAPSGLGALVRGLQGYFRGKAVDPARLPAELEPGPLTPFVGRVYARLREIPRGVTVSYGELAELAGSPGAARAVGSALARNRIPLLIPCHRVLAAGGRCGGFSAPGGVATKSVLLGLEGVLLATAG